MDVAIFIVMISFGIGRADWESTVFGGNSDDDDDDDDDNECVDIDMVWIEGCL